MRRRWRFRPALGGAVVQMRWFNTNPSVQRKNNAEFFGAAKITEYDIDREKWGKQQQWHTMDCVLDPTVEMPKRWSYAGLRKKLSLWLTMRKILERRPGFEPEKELREVYINYKRVAFTPDPNQLKALCRLTTWNEAVRIEAETKKAQQELEQKHAAKLSADGVVVPKTMSWKQMSVKTHSYSDAKEKKSTDGAASVSSSLPPLGAPLEDEALDVRTPLMEIKLEAFDIINMYVGQMTNEDWLQVTVRTTGKFRSHQTAPVFDRLHEYPVFELKMGDGITQSNNNPFSIVAVMDRDGSRYGKDGNDAAALRKSLAQSRKSSWFS